MGFFNKLRTDGASHDGQGEERRGMVDVIKYNGLPDDIIWKFPYENITTGARLIVNQSQEAIFLRNGAVCDVFGPNAEGHRLSTNNLPLLQKLVNLPFGGNTPFAAEVWFVNLTAKRNLKFGTPESFRVKDPQYDNLPVKVQARGSYGIRVTDGSMLLRELVGTEHLFETSDIIALFRDKVLETLRSAIYSYTRAHKISVIDLAEFAPEISNSVKERIGEDFARYGIAIENYNLEYIGADENDSNYKELLDKQFAAGGAHFTARKEAIEAAGHAEALRVQGTNYQQERQFDVMETAAGNEGAGQFMGAGMGLGMGFGMGNAFGTSMQGMAGSMNPQNTPPPPPAPAAYHILVNGAQQGPYDLNMLRQMAMNGTLTQTTYVWTNGMPQWTQAGNCPDLQGLFGAVPPPPPPMP